MLQNKFNSASLSFEVLKEECVNIEAQFVAKFLSESSGFAHPLETIFRLPLLLDTQQ